MRNIFKSFIIMISIFMLCGLVACGSETPGILDQIDTSEKNNNNLAEIVSSGDIVFDGLNGIDTVANSEDFYRFNSVITVSPGAKWVLAKDIYGNDTIATKIAPLNVGDNTYYIVVTSGDETKIEVYTVVIRRKPIYTVTFNTNGGTPVESQQIEEGFNLEAVTTSLEGYTFDGWYIGEEKVELPYIVWSDLTLNAKFVPNKYTISINPQGYNYIGEVSYDVTYGEAFYCPVASGNSVDKVYTTSTFKGWKYNDEYITDSNGNSLNNWNFTSNITITPEIVEDGLYFGSYPQTKVEANSSNGLSSITFDSSTWTDYGYYINGNVESYMYYYDVDVDNNGNYDYRGVYFTQYRPNYTNSNIDFGSEQFDNGYNTNNIYWFEYEPIKWEILETKDGKALILADLVLDAQDYNHTRDKKTINGKTIYANNYEYSHIRQWLNDTFYDTAFNDLEKAIIETTTVNTQESGYIYFDTNDKLFLLSRQEVNNYKNIITAVKVANTTDYAKSQGAMSETSDLYLGDNYWLLRSPALASRDEVEIVCWDGYISDGFVHRNWYGVRPACWITL